MLKIDDKEIHDQLNGTQYDALKFAEKGLFFFVTDNETLFKKTLNEGYEKADVVKLDPIEKEVDEDVSDN